MKKQSFDIGFVVAMREEADILASRLGLMHQSVKSGTHTLYTDTSGSITIITPGEDPNFFAFGQPVCRVGKVAAGVVTAILVNEYHPKLIINTGTAGGILHKNMHIGDVIMADYVTSHDIRIPLPGYKEYGTRKIPLKLPRLSFLKTAYTIGTISSGESFTTSPEEWNNIRQSGALAKEMEAFGVLHALEILNWKGPRLIIKAITDLENEHTHEQTSSEDFQKNFSLAMRNLSKTIQEIIENKNVLI